jgi:hypothetical protein
MIAGIARRASRPWARIPILTHSVRIGILTHDRYNPSNPDKE